MAFIELSIAQGAELVSFPELSITGYEPKLAKDLATGMDDSRLDVFQECSDANQITIATGLPLFTGTRPQIGMILFRPFRPRSNYAKQILHADEKPWFAVGESQYLLNSDRNVIAPAICYESLQPEHAERAAELGADIYLVSVAKPAAAMSKAMLHYPGVARDHNMHVIMADAIGPSDDFISIGGSAAWNNRGELLAQMDDESEGILVMDTTSGSATVCLFPYG